jgi:hypothetical protein
MEELTVSYAGNMKIENAGYRDCCGPFELAHRPTRSINHTVDVNITGYKIIVLFSNYMYSDVSTPPPLQTYENIPSNEATYENCEAPAAESRVYENIDERSVPAADFGGPEPGERYYENYQVGAEDSNVYENYDFSENRIFQPVVFARKNGGMGKDQSLEDVTYKAKKPADVTDKAKKPADVTDKAKKPADVTDKAKAPPSVTVKKQMPKEVTEGETRMETSSNDSLQQFIRSIEEVGIEI